jgi:hypothetical protein
MPLGFCLVQVPRVLPLLVRHWFERLLAHQTFTCLLLGWRGNTSKHKICERRGFRTLAIGDDSPLSANSVGCVFQFW